MQPLHLSLFATPPHPCSYFAGRDARTLFVDPQSALDDRVYQALIDKGFRRSGEHVYRPECPGCAACIPLRLPLQGWRPRRNQRRAWNRVAKELEVMALPPIFDPAHFDLYRRYIGSRHGDGDMADPSPDTYLRFLTAAWCTTRFVEFRLRGELLGVAVTDYLPGGLSAVYTFFEPEMEAVSPGVVAVTWQIQEGRRLGLDHLYLGYWIEDCRKMAYKRNFRPHQRYIDGDWIDAD